MVIPGSMLASPGNDELRVKSNFLNRIKLFLPVQSRLQKDFSSPQTQITFKTPDVPPIQRGVSRSSRTLVRDAMDAAALLTNSANADGEVVWS
jgi:hypothetical protein